MSQPAAAPVPQKDMNQHPSASPTSEVYDLAALSGPARRLIKVYDDVAAGRPHRQGRLDKVLAELDSLPPMPGQLGRDVRLLAAGGSDADRSTVIRAIERLRRVTSVQPTPPGQKPKRWMPRPRTKRARHSSNGQLSLPGMDPTEDGRR